MVCELHELQKLRKQLRAVLLLLTLPFFLLAPNANAINMTIGDVVAQQLSEYGFQSTSSVLSFDGGATDQLYQMYAFLGNANGMIPVTAANFNIGTAISATGNVATSSVVLDPNGAAALGLGLSAGDIQIDYTFSLIDDTSANDWDGFEWDVSILNLSGLVNPLNLSFYMYMDLDLGGATDFGDDEAISSFNQILVSDANDGLQYAWNASGGTATHYQVGSYPNVLNTLNNMTVAGNLSDTQASFGPADFTGAFQYDFVLANGQSAVFDQGAIGNPAAYPVPEPGTAVLVAMGALILTQCGKSRRDV